MHVLPLLTACVLWTCALSADPPIPPKMLFKPRDIVYFLDRQEFNCHAEGTPRPKYTWMRRPDDRSPFKEIMSDSRTRVDVNKRTGTLILNAPTRLDEGLYQCFAENTLGKAMSSVFKLVKASVGTFPEVKTNTVNRQQGSHTILKCRDIPKSIPYQEFGWEKSETTLPESSNTVIDQEGHLHIIVTPMEYNKLLFRCSVYNGVQRLKSYSKDHKLIVAAAATTTRAPSIDYFTKTETEALMGNNSFTLQCIPDGSPVVPEITWTRDGQDVTRIARYNGRVSFRGVGNIKYTITISDIQEADEGKYRCHIANRRSIYKELKVIVNSKPLHIDGSDELIPTDTVLLASTSRTFQCDGRSANAHSKVTVKWYKNSVLLGQGQNNNIFVKNTVLTVHQASKAHDIMSLTCVLTNKFGSKFIGFSINVIQPTKITEKRVIMQQGDDKTEWSMDTSPTDGTVIKGPDAVKITLRVRAEADALLKDELTRTWRKDNEIVTTQNSQLPVYVDQQTGDLILQSNNSGKNEIKQIHGNYTCEIRVPGVKAADLLLMTYLKSPTTVTIPVVVPAAGFPIWIVGLVLGVLLLILLIILIVFFMYRNRGAIWKVDEKERAAGNNIEKELADSGFHDLGRADGPDDEKKPIDQRSLSDDEPPPGEDTASLDEYGEPDMSKFNEEGSFIDMYGKPVRKPGQVRPQSVSSGADDQQQLYNNVTPPPVYSQYPEQRGLSNDTMV